MATMRAGQSSAPTRTAAAQSPAIAPDGVDQRRADAVRNREAILAGAVEVFTRKPEAGLAEVARASGLTRTTVYAHFATREELLEEIAAQALARTIEALDTARPEAGPADEALVRVLQSSWQQVGRQAGLMDMVGRALGPRAMEMHAPVRERLLKLIRRGRRDGTFRRDVPERWLLTTYFTLVHAAGHEVAAGNSTYKEAEGALGRILLGAFCTVDRR
jgi:AcrR family transcriptional regulator